MLGFPLFERSSRGMQLTAVATQFRERTRALRASLGDAIKEAADMHLGELGLLRVGVSPLYAQRLFVPATVALHEGEAAQWILPGPAVTARRNVEGRLAEAGLPPPRVTVEVSNTAGGQLNRLVAQSDLVSIMSESQLGMAVGEGLAPLPIADARFARTIGALTRKGAALPPLAPRFLELLEETARGETAPARRAARRAGRG